MTPQTKEAVEQQQYLTFLLCGEEYAINILRVKEIIGYDTVTTVPKTPKWVRGVINLRGNVVPVVDLAVRFGLADRQVTKTTCIVIVDGQVDGQNTLIGVMADAVSQVMDVAAGDLQEVPTFGTRIKVDYLQGMVQLGKKFVLLLDIDKVLSADEVQDLTAAATKLTEAEDNATSPNLAEAAPTPDEDKSVPEANDGAAQ
ncbi:MAG: chemotaxis protein CheW [Terriglobales bacterium]